MHIFPSPLAWSYLDIADIYPQVFVLCLGCLWSSRWNDVPPLLGCVHLGGLWLLNGCLCVGLGGVLWYLWWYVVAGGGLCWW